MADSGFSISIDPDQKFRAAVDAVGREVNDLRVPFRQIAREWFQSNKAIFTIADGPGKWKDLKPSYRDQKERWMGSAYPMFRGRTGALERSITMKDDDNAIANILSDNKSMILGTRVPYARPLQTGAKMGPYKMPARPFVLIGAEQTGPPEFNMRLEAWIIQLKSYVEQVTGKWIGSNYTSHG